MDVAHIAPWKKDEVSQIVELMNTHRVVGVISVSGIPGPQLLQMRRMLRGKAELRVSKNTLIHLALKESNKKVAGINALAKEVDGQSAIMVSNDNPFKLYKIIQKSQSRAPA
jgi:large subunit ribosomal protein L10